MPRIDPLSLPISKQGSDYPAPYDQPVAGRTLRNLGAALGTADFVANHVVLPSGGWSSQRHWHEGEDEIVVILSGNAVLVDDDGRHAMAAGDVAIFPKGDRNGHHLINESDRDCVLLAMGKPEASAVAYPDIDLRWSAEHGETHRDGTPY